MYKIAGVIVRLEGLNSSYISHRMKNYKIEAGDNVSADLNIHFKENNCIVVPAGRDFRRLDAWYWIDRGSEGYSAVKQYSKYRATLIRADIDRQCKNAVIEYVDIKDHLDVTTDYLLGVNLYEESGNISYVASPDMAENINLEHKLTHLFRCLPQSLKEYIVHSEEYLLDNFVKEVKDDYI